MKNFRDAVTSSTVRDRVVVVIAAVDVAGVVGCMKVSCAGAMRCCAVQGCGRGDLDGPAPGQ